MDNLNNSESVFDRFGLTRNDEVRSTTVDTDIDFIHFDLTDSLNSRSQMVLDRIASQAGKDVDQAVVSGAGK